MNVGFARGGDFFCLLVLREPSVFEVGPVEACAVGEEEEEVSETNNE